MKKSLFLTALLMSLMFILVACGGGNGESEEETSEEASTEESTDEESAEEGSADEESTEEEGSEDESASNGNGLAVTGDVNEEDDQIVGEGSSTVFPILNVLVEDFNAEYGIPVELGGNGTGSGFSALIDGSAQFANASRPIADEEQQQLDDAGVEVTEMLIATDGLTVAVNQENDFVDSLTFDELNTIYSGEASSWSDVREDFPDEPITAYGPDQSHGTHDFFNEEVMDEEGVEAELIQDTNQVVSSVVGDPNSIGFFGYAFYLENQDTLKAVPIQGPEDEEAVEPTNENVMTFEYPLSRPLYSYVSNEALENNETLHTFFEFVVVNSTEAAEAVGYVPLEEDAQQEQYDKLPNTGN
ncbi:phosphate ABC transporter substrate-binding protein PstS family protein [Salinicoccus halitifaciens]|uniref:Phosphate-binding protein n=1 Tax=Salinicoccus halitifaciens TaxID=1073415 RepID=A0ABV2E6W8_9STAP|nr:phosphate ABC transporter substrate-binding protein PstS family protein [Salinicoccus halitifaciens]MCD2136882.1 phosphate ABC transporter substrate-binding protein PstS family protein [Salinicoccus halitifaciens]